MNTYIIIQTCISKQSLGNTEISNIVRRIDADSEEIAIGKFVLATRNINMIKKLDMECYELSELKTC